MLSQSNAGSVIPPTSSLGDFVTESELSPDLAEHSVPSEFDHPHYDPHHPVARQNNRWVCTSCGAQPTSYGTGRCECDLPHPDGSDVRCIGTLRPVYTSRAFCSGCQEFVPGHVVGLCFACEFDAEMPRTVKIATLSLREIADEWWTEQAMRGGAL